jgi:hypothetical protein
MACERERFESTFTNLIFTLQHLVVPSFAAGALLATAVFLIIPKAIHLLSGWRAWCGTCGGRTEARLFYDRTEARLFYDGICYQLDVVTDIVVTRI